MFTQSKMNSFQLLLPVLRLSQLFGLIQHRIISQSSTYQIKKSKFLTIYCIIFYILNILSQAILIYIFLKKIELGYILLIKFTDFFHSFSFAIHCLLGSVITLKNGGILCKYSIDLALFQLKYFKHNLPFLRKQYFINITLLVLGFFWIMFLNILFMLKPEKGYIDRSDQILKRIAAIFPDVANLLFIMQFIFLINGIRVHYFLLNNAILESKFKKDSGKLLKMFKKWKESDKLAKDFAERINYLYGNIHVWYISSAMLEIIYSVPTFMNNGLERALRVSSWHVVNLIYLLIITAISALTKAEVRFIQFIKLIDLIF